MADSLTWVRDDQWLLPGLKAVLRHPSLYGIALRQLFALAAPGWWRTPPFLPLPPPDYLRFRIATMYGGDGRGGFEPQALVDYLRWCRSARQK